MPGDYTICTAMSGSGVRIGMGTTLPVRQSIPQGHQMAHPKSSGVAVGISTPGAAARHAAITTRPAIASFSWDFDLLPSFHP